MESVSFRPSSEMSLNAVLRIEVLIPLDYEAGVAEVGSKANLQRVPDRTPLSIECSRTAFGEKNDVRQQFTVASPLYGGGFRII